MGVSFFLYTTSGFKFLELNLVTDGIVACQIRCHLRFKAKKKSLKKKIKRQQRAPFSFSYVDYQYKLVTTGKITFIQNRIEQKK